MVTISRTGEFACRAQFELRHSLAFLRAFTPVHGEQEIHRNLLTKAIMVRGRPVVFRLFQPREASDLSPPRVRYELGCDGIVDAETERLAVDRIAFFLSTDEDLAPFYALALRDTALSSVVARWRGLHHVKFPSPFEAACWGVLNQRIGMREARKMKDAIVHTLGASVDCGGATHWAFPEAARVAEFGAEGLRRLLSNDRKAKALHAFGRAFAEATDTFLRQAPQDDLKAWLAQIHGVGPFTNGFVLYRGFGKFERVPLSRKFTAAVERAYGRNLSMSDIDDLSDRYSRWGGHWALYVWASTFDRASEPALTALAQPSSSVTIG